MVITISHSEKLFLKMSFLSFDLFYIYLQHIPLLYELYNFD